MTNTDKRNWLNQYGYVQFEFVDQLTKQHTLQWSVFGKAFLFTGKGVTDDKAYDDLYDVVRGTLYNICDMDACS